MISGRILILCCTVILCFAGQSVFCPGSKKQCRCSQTDEGITCPAGYYCPSYTEEQINDNSNILSTASCIVNSTTNAVQCPCSPGFYCPENTETPTYCCEGFFCKTPDHIKECGEGKFCKIGFVEELPCGSNNACPKGSSKPSNDGVIVLIIFFSMGIYLAFLVKNYLETKVADHEQALIEEAKKSEDEMEMVGLNKQDPYNQVDNYAVQSISPGEEVDQALSDWSFEIKFCNLGLTLKNGIRIMDGVNGSFRPERLCAIMGPSGCGKTTIINLITGKAKKTEGTVYVNGEEVDDLSKFRKLVGFVPQEDVMIRQLTVRQNIEFSAMYRLPVEMAYEDKVKAVNETIIDLGIDHVQHSIIGDERERGVSGGQRKRVNVGIEIVAKPKVLFLDEPTSGLDSTSSVSLVKQLKNIAVKQNVTVASVIHQPSIPTILEFDDIMLLGKGGRVIYHGPIADALQYFHSIGFDAKPHDNPADFFLDVASGAIKRSGDPDFKPPDLFKFWIEHIGLSSETSERSAVSIDSKEYQDRIAHERNPFGSVISFLWATWGFVEYLFYSVITTFELIYDDLIQLKKELMSEDEVRNTPGYFGQFYYCFMRAVVQKYRRFGSFLSQMMIHVLLAVVVSSVSSDLQYVGPLPDVVCAITTQELVGACKKPLVDNYQGIANFLCFGIIFAAISVSTLTFGGEQVNYWRECAAGMKTPPYYFAKWIVEVPNIILAATFFWAAFLSKFPNTSSGGAIFLLLLAFYSYAWSVGFVLSAIAPPRYVFLAGVLYALLVAVSFSGANPTLKRVQTFPKSYSWLWSVSGSRWMLEGFYVSQVEYYEDVPSGPLDGDKYMDIDAGLDEVGYNINNFNKDIGALFWNAFGWGFAAMMIMMFTSLDKKR